MKFYTEIVLTLLSFVLLNNGAFAQPMEKAISLQNSNSIQNNDMMQSDIPMFEYANNGLRSKVCYNILEDVDGYLWIVGSEGVSRYDGISFVNFLQSDNRDGTNNIAQAICEDTITNRIWISLRHRDAIVGIDRQTYEIDEINYKIDDKDNINILSLFNYNDSLLLAKSRLGICLINKKTGETSTTILSEESRKNIQDQFIRLNNDDYFICAGGLYKLKGRRVSTPEVEKIEIGIGTENSFRHIAIKDEHNLLVEVSIFGKHYDIYSYNVVTKQKEFIVQCPKPIKSMTCMNDGVWLWTTVGCYFFRYADKKTFNYSTRNTSLQDNEFHSSLKLRNQPILFVCTANGVMKCDYFNSKFKVTDIRRVSESDDCNPLMIHKDSDGTYWLWLLDGMYRRKKDEYLFKKVNTDNVVNVGILGCDEDTVRKILYFDCVKKIVRYDMKTENIRIIASAEVNSRILTSTIQSNGHLLFADTKNAYDYNPNTNQITKIVSIPANISGITALQFDGDSILWIGNKKSQLYSCHLNTKTFKEETVIGSEEKNITHIRCTYNNGLCEVWIAALSNGLNYYLPSKKHVTKIEYHPMLFGVVSNIEKDAQNNIWVSSNEGLLCINNNDGNVYEYRSDIYNIGNRFNRTATSLSSDGNLIMGGPNFFVEFNSANFSHNNYYPQPVISSYKFVNSTAFDYDNYIEGEYYDVSDTIEIPAGIRSVQIQPRMLNFSNSRYNLIQWRMPEKNNLWTTINTTSPIIFSTLTRGLSKIELRSCDINGTPISNIRTIYLNKDVYFYEHPIFYALLIMLGMILIVAIIVVRSYSERLRRQRLEHEVEIQAGEIKRANRQLRASQRMIEKQNIELREHRDNLELQVAERTAELEVARQKAEESSQLKSAFLANLSHEVRTPMNCIVGFSKLMADPDCTPAEQREFAHLIQESSNSMLVLIGDLLDVSRIERGQLRVNINDFEVSNEIYDVYRLLSVERKNPNVEFLLDSDNNLHTRIIHSDKDRFRQIIINICYNAFKFTEQGYVCIHANIIQPEQLSQYAYPAKMPIPTDVFELLLIRIEDTGIGIPADKTEIIFEPFRKLNNNKTLYPGLGLGLNIVKNLIQLLKGQIWLTSVEQKGTTFYFYLPF